MTLNGTTWLIALVLTLFCVVDTETKSTDELDQDVKNLRKKLDDEITKLRTKLENMINEKNDDIQRDFIRMTGKQNRQANSHKKLRKEMLNRTETVRKALPTLRAELIEKMDAKEDRLKISIKNEADGTDRFKNETREKFKSQGERMNYIDEKHGNSSTNIRKSLGESTANIRQTIKDNYNAVTAKIKERRIATEELVGTVKDDLKKTREDLLLEQRGLETSLKNQQTLVTELSRQTMMQQFAAEQTTRSSGDSGVKIVRGRARGPANYYEFGLFGPAFGMMHDHSDYENTVGMGEMTMVMNGLEFQTRHNDYKLMMASPTDKSMHATEPIPYPAVPPSVANKASVDDQILEMREYFKAFAQQDSSIRDYKPYFRAVLCYVEGAWFAESSQFDEPFASDRHKVDATGWINLQNKVRYAAYTGTKSRLENFSYLPKTIMSIDEETGKPIYSQWNYRILCQPLKDDLPTSVFRPQDDLAYRVPREQTPEVSQQTRGARFKLQGVNEGKDQSFRLLDRLMAEVPGKDNNNINLTQINYGEQLQHSKHHGTPLNTGYYSRSFSYPKPGAMGLREVARGYNDANMWVAQTTQDRVAPMGVRQCRGKGPERVCQVENTRMTYALPLEIIYLTPLLSWNPYNLRNVDPTTARGGEAKTRNGQKTVDKAYNGTASVGIYYRTPASFFRGKVNKDDPADTVRNAIGVLDPAGGVRRVTASGVKIFTQALEGVGRIRMRYPIIPVHGEGSTVWKELNALKDTIKEMKLSNGTAGPKKIFFMMSVTTQEDPGEHSHTFSLTWEQYLKAKKGQEVKVVTTENHSHAHNLQVKYTSSAGWRYTKCGLDPPLPLCWDGHPTAVTLISAVTAAMEDQMMMMPGT